MMGFILSVKRGDSEQIVKISDMTRNRSSRLSRDMSWACNEGNMLDYTSLRMTAA